MKSWVLFCVIVNVVVPLAMGQDDDDDSSCLPCQSGCPILRRSSRLPYCFLCKVPCYPCDPLWPVPFYYPALDSCDYAWECRGGELRRFSCPTGQEIDHAQHECVPLSNDSPFRCSRIVNA